MVDDKSPVSRLGLDWERVRKLRRIFWDAEVRKAEIRLRLTRLMAERKRLEREDDSHT